MSPLQVRIAGIGAWAPGFAHWPALAAGLRGEGSADAAVVRPSPDLLAAAERRRAPMPVLLACEIAAQACAAAGQAPAELPSVFVSTHGDLGITDHLCETLARAPREVSPIRFHNSVHNAPAGYWTIAAGCHAPSTSVSAWHISFASALVEAAVEVASGAGPVLLAAYDTAAAGALADVVPAQGNFGVAFVLAAEGPGSTLRLGWSAEESPAQSTPVIPAALAALSEANPMAAQCLPLLARMAANAAFRHDLAAGTQSRLELEWTPAA